MAAQEAFPSRGDRGGEGPSMERLAQRLEMELGLQGFFERVGDELATEFSSGARLFLLVPLAEAREVQQELDRGSAEESLRKLVNAMAESPAETDHATEGDPDLRRRLEPSSSLFSTEQKPRFRSSLSAIKAFWSKFCDIPPFCGET